MTITSRWLKKQVAEQRKIRQNQPPVSSEEARRQFVRVEQGSANIVRDIGRSKRVEQEVLDLLDEPSTR